MDVDETWLALLRMCAILGGGAAAVGRCFRAGLAGWLGGWAEAAWRAPPQPVSGVRIKDFSGGGLERGWAAPPFQYCLDFSHGVSINTGWVKRALCEGCEIR